jgi:hypothetical protein
MKKSELKQLIKEEITKALSESTTILSQEFGSYDDAKFLKVVWRMSISELEKLLENTISDLTYAKNVAPKGKIMGTFARRDIEKIKGRIKFLKEIILSKKNNPEFIPDYYK